MQHWKALLDANVLYPAGVRDIAVDGRRTGWRRSIPMSSSWVSLMHSMERCSQRFAIIAPR